MTSITQRTFACTVEDLGPEDRGVEFVVISPRGTRTRARFIGHDGAESRFLDTEISVAWVIDQSGWTVESSAPDRADDLRERAEIRKVLTDALGPLPTDHTHMVGALRVRLAERLELAALRAFRSRVEECGSADTAELMLKRIQSASWACGRAIAKAARGAELGSRVEGA